MGLEGNKLGLCAASLALGVGVGYALGRVLFSQSRRPSWCRPPSSSWTPGTPQPSPYPCGPDDYILHAPAEHSAAENYPLVISTIVPRPIALVSSFSREGEQNLSPFSYFGAMGHDPPLIAISIVRSGARGGGKKDTLHNIEETGEFVVNIMSEWFINAANHTCGNFDRGVNEMELAGLTPIPSLKVAPPRVAESAVHMECRLLQTFPQEYRGKPTTTIVLAEVLLFHISKGVEARTPSGKLAVDPVKLQPMSRLGGNTYGRTLQLFDLPRPDRKVA